MVCKLRYFKNLVTMNNDTSPTVQPQLAPVDLVMVVIGPTVLAAVIKILTGAQWRPSAQVFVAGCVLGFLAWRWPKVTGPMLLVLSIPVMLYSLFLALYTLGMPYTLFLLWGSTAFLAGGVGVLRRRKVALAPKRHFFVQASLLGALAAVFLLYFLIMWPPRGKAILLGLPIIAPAAVEQVQAGFGGNWSAYWTTPRLTIPQAVESLKGPLESDGWTIADSALDPAGGVALVSAQREAYSLVVMYDPGNPSPYWSKGPETGAFMTASVRKAKARHFPGLIPLP